MKTADFRVQSTAPDAPSTAEVAVLYSNASGVLMTRLSDGSHYQAGTRMQASGHPSSVLITHSAAGIYGDAGTFTYTGHVIGQTGVRGTGFLLGTPHAWLQITGPANETWVVPAFQYVSV